MVGASSTTHDRIVKQGSIVVLRPPDRRRPDEEVFVRLASSIHSGEEDILPAPRGSALASPRRDSPQGRFRWNWPASKPTGWSSWPWSSWPLGVRSDLNSLPQAFLAIRERMIMSSMSGMMGGMMGGGGAAGPYKPTSEEITPPRPITPTFGCAKETSHNVGSWFHDPRPRRASWWRVVGRGLVGGGA